jgi:acetyltransferase-like isoleucine patch superfamily enzyme/dTDP-4-dehydrorhamnose 3,5-epimerase-like enzyme
VKGPIVHDRALCESGSVGAGTRIWAFAHVLPGAVIGTDCNICDGVFVEGDVVVGDRVTVKCGVQLWDGVRLGDDVFVGPNATFTNDPFPRSRQRPERFATTVVENGASIGANATILPGVRIGARAMVGAGAVVTRDVPPGAIVVGNPGRIVGYDGAPTAQLPATDGEKPGPMTRSIVRGVGLYRLPHFRDMRGSLAVAEFEDHVPFAPKRCFMVYDVPGKDVRGEHAHRQCHQFLICLAGSVHVVVDDGTEREQFVLGDPSLGLHLPPMVWGIQYKYTPDAVLLVLASEHYDAGDYIRDYSAFLAESRRR